MRVIKISAHFNLDIGATTVNNIWILSLSDNTTNGALEKLKISLICKYFYFPFYPATTCSSSIRYRDNKNRQVRQKGKLYYVNENKRREKKVCRCKFHLSIFHVHASHLIVLLMLAVSISENGMEKIQKAIFRKTRKAIKQPWLTSFWCFSEKLTTSGPGGECANCLFACSSLELPQTCLRLTWLSFCCFYCFNHFEIEMCLKFSLPHSQCSRHSAWRRRTTTLVCTHECFRRWDWIMHASLDLLFFIENPKKTFFLPLLREKFPALSSVNACTNSLKEIMVQARLSSAPNAQHSSIAFYSHPLSLNYWLGFPSTRAHEDDDDKWCIFSTTLVYCCCSLFCCSFSTLGKRFFLPIFQKNNRKCMRMLTTRLHLSGRGKKCLKEFFSVIQHIFH